MFRGCIRRVFALVFLVALLGGAWLFRDRLRAAWYDIRGMREQPLFASPELAAAAERKLESLRDGSRDQVALSGIELQSLLVHQYDGLMPGFLHDPTIELRGDQLRLRARVPVDKLPRIDGLGEVMAILPDTAELAVAGKLLPLDSGRIAFGIDEVSAARVPLPRRFVAPALERIGRREEAGLPRDAVALPLPPGAAAAYVRRDSLVLIGWRVPPGE